MRLLGMKVLRRTEEVTGGWITLNSEELHNLLYSPDFIRLKSSKVKLNLSLCLTKHHAMKTYCGNEGIAPRILDLGTRWS
jgi:hypothetical protein